VQLTNFDTFNKCCAWLRHKELFKITSCFSYILITVVAVLQYFLPRDAMTARYILSSVCLSIANRSSTKRRITDCVIN